MRIHETDLKDARLIGLEPLRDNRGFFARTFCEREFAAHGMHTSFPQHSISHTATKASIRGMQNASAYLGARAPACLDRHPPIFLSRKRVELSPDFDDAFCISRIWRAYAHSRDRSQGRPADRA